MNPKLRVRLGAACGSLPPRVVDARRICGVDHRAYAANVELIAAAEPENRARRSRGPQACRGVPAPQSEARSRGRELETCFAIAQLASEPRSAQRIAAQLESHRCEHDEEWR